VGRAGLLAGQASWAGRRRPSASAAGLPGPRACDKGFRAKYEETKFYFIFFQKQFYMNSMNI
jgi:hypothetical protein